MHRVTSLGGGWSALVTMLVTQVAGGTCCAGWVQCWLVPAVAPEIQMTCFSHLVMLSAAADHTRGLVARTTVQWVQGGVWGAARSRRCCVRDLISTWNDRGNNTEDVLVRGSSV